MEIRIKNINEVAFYDYPCKTGTYEFIISRGIAFDPDLFEGMREQGGKIFICDIEVDNPFEAAKVAHKMIAKAERTANKVQKFLDGVSAFAD